MNKSHEKVIATLLLEMGIQPHHKGYKYARTAVELILTEPTIITGRKVTKELYPCVAAVHQTTPSRVERSIRFAVEQAHGTMTARYRNAIGRYSGVNKPCNSYFLAQCAEVLRLGMAS